MKNALRNLFFAALLLFAGSFDSCTFGVAYDVENKLYPEIDSNSCTLSTVYGQRWMRFGFVAFSLGMSFVLAAIIMQLREKQSEDLRRSIFEINKFAKSKFKIE